MTKLVSKREKHLKIMNEENISDCIALSLRFEDILGQILKCINFLPGK